MSSCQIAIKSPFRGPKHSANTDRLNCYKISLPEFTTNLNGNSVSLEGVIGVRHGHNYSSLGVDKTVLGEKATELTLKNQHTSGGTATKISSTANTNNGFMGTLEIAKTNLDAGFDLSAQLTAGNGKTLVEERQGKGKPSVSLEFNIGRTF